MRSISPPSSPRIDSLSIHYPAVMQVDVLRLDLIHLVISGNKWYKLQYYLESAIRGGHESIVTWGGAWSNHIVATAAACQLAGVRSVGLIRGEKPAVLSATLQQAMELGMELQFLTRQQFDAQILPPALSTQNHYCIPAGGYGQEGMLGASEILSSVRNDYTHLLCAVGTGTTLAGLAHACSSQQQVLGISALKEHPELEPAIAGLLQYVEARWELRREFHFGGYARWKPELLRFMNEFYEKTGIPSDFVYTGKLFYGFEALLKQGYFPRTARVLLIHSGGLQGNRSLAENLLRY